MPNQPFLKAYEFEKRYKIDRLKMSIEEAEESYKKFHPKTIDFCKCALDSICKKILEEREKEYKNTDSLQSLVGNALNSLNFENGQILAGITNIIGGTSGIAKGLGEIRNEKGVAGHGYTEKSPLPNKAEISIFVATFANITSIILALLDEEPIDIATTTLDFEILERKLKLEELNQHIDRNVEVEYDEEQGVIFIEGSELKPSEILYKLDRLSYKQLFENSKETLSKLDIDNTSETLEELISDELCNNRFDDFHPGHYGYEPPEIYIDDIERQEAVLIATGSVSTTARLGSSNPDDSMDVDYSSNFKAEFSYDYDKYENNFSFELEDLILEKAGWWEVEEDYELPPEFSKRRNPSPKKEGTDLF